MKVTNKNHPPSEHISTVINKIRIFGIELDEAQLAEGVHYNRQNRVLQVDNLNIDWKNHDSYEYNFVKTP